MGSAAYKKTIEVSTDGGTTWNTLPATTGSLNHAGDVLDDTQLGANPAYRSRIYGLRDWSVSVTCNWAAGDAALTAVRNAWLNGTTIDVRYLPDGQVANGFQGTAVVESYNQSGDVGALETVEISLQADGALAAAT